MRLSVQKLKDQLSKVQRREGFSRNYSFFFSERRRGGDVKCKVERETGNGNRSTGRNESKGMCQPFSLRLNEVMNKQCSKLEAIVDEMREEKDKLEMVSSVSNETHAAFLQKLEDDREATLRELEEERLRQRSQFSDQMVVSTLGRMGVFNLFQRIGRASCRQIVWNTQEHSQPGLSRLHAFLSV